MENEQDVAIPNAMTVGVSIAHALQAKSETQGEPAQVRKVFDLVAFVYSMPAPVKIIQRRDGSGLWVYIADILVFSIEGIQENHGSIKLDEPGETPPDYISNWKPGEGLTSRGV